MSRIWTSFATIALGRGDFAPVWRATELDGLTRFALLRITASGAWRPVAAGMEECGPDGLIGASWPPDLLLLPDCPVGALIGRLGGSSATLKATGVDPASGDMRPFALGVHAVVRVPEKATGPLFIGFNQMQRPVTVLSLAIEIEGARG